MFVSWIIKEGAEGQRKCNGVCEEEKSLQTNSSTVVGSATGRSWFLLNVHVCFRLVCVIWLNISDQLNYKRFTTSWFCSDGVKANSHEQVAEVCWPEIKCDKKLLLWQQNMIFLTRCPDINRHVSGNKTRTCDETLWHLQLCVRMRSGYFNWDAGTSLSASGDHPGYFWDVGTSPDVFMASKLGYFKQGVEISLKLIRDLLLNLTKSD